MYYALVHYLDEYPAAIDSFRQKYDPRVDLVQPHLTFVFPTDVSIGEETLVSHIVEVLKNKTAFSLTLSGIAQSWDNFIFLLVSAGTEQVTGLHDDLYQGPLLPFLRQDIEYIPHVTLGRVAGEDQRALAEAKALNVNFAVTVKELTLIKRESEMTPVLWSRKFTLDE